MLEFDSLFREGPFIEIYLQIRATSHWVFDESLAIGS
jgi:hypothetical protein